MSDATPPTFVRTPDGRLEPFDAGRIARSLFVSGEAIGKRDPFLCRELADGVVHFLSAACEGGVVTAAQVAEETAKVVRELGHPDLALAYERRRPTEATPGVFSRDVLAAHEAGLIELTDLRQPDTLAGKVVEQIDWRTDGLVRALAAAREAAGAFVAVDGMEYLERLHDHAALLEGLDWASGVRAVVNLNVPLPHWADVEIGPLFGTRAIASTATSTQRAGWLAHDLAAGTQGRCCIDWHVGETSLAADGRLETVAELALGGARVGFVFDRPRRPVALGEGLDRRHPAVLARVGLNLPALAQQPGMLADFDRFRQRLGSLVRLAITVGTQKRDHLRRQNRRAITDGFLLDRARLVVVPVGLDEVVTLYTGWSMANGGESLDRGRLIVQRLNEVLRQDGRAAALEGCVEGAVPPGGPGPERARVPGVTPWAPEASIRAQLSAAGTLHAAAEGGTLALHLPREAIHTAATLAEALREAYRQTAVGRVVLVQASRGA